MTDIFADHVFILYIIITITAVYGSGLFIWWWIKQGQASAIYMYVTLFLIGSAIEHGVEGYVRYIHLLQGESAMGLFQHCWVWAARLYVWLIAIVAIVIHMSYRAFIQRYYK